MPNVRDRLLAAPIYTWNALAPDAMNPPRRPGVYAWLFRARLPGVPLTDCFTRDGMSVLYVGISPESEASRATLRSRIRYHFRGNAEGSTLRRTLGCLLEPEIGTCLRRVGSGNRFTFADAEAALSEWMAAKAAVAWLEVERPWLVEPEIIRSLSLPLNIRDNEHHAFYTTLRRTRHDANQRARSLAIVGEINDGQATTAISQSVPTNAGAPPMTPMESLLMEAWRDFKRYVETDMGYSNSQNRRECLNGAGAFVDFLLGRRPRAGVRYATSDTWPTS